MSKCWNTVQEMTRRSALVSTPPIGDHYGRWRGSLGGIRPRHFWWTPRQVRRLCLWLGPVILKYYLANLSLGAHFHLFEDTPAG